jgi:hypothetical protein
MAFDIYPDAATAAALGKPDRTPVHLAEGEAMAAFVPVAERVGPDLGAGDQPTTFLRFALSGASVPQNKQPWIELIAHSPDPGPAAIVDPKTAVSPAAAVSLVDDAGAVVARACFEPPYANNVYLLKVAILRDGTTLSLRITNKTGAQREIVWVAADNEAETQQPWLHATLDGSAPIEIAFETEAGDMRSAEPIRVHNFGTGGLTVLGVSPAVAAPYALDIQQATLGPNPSSPALVTLRFQAPARSAVFPPTMVTFIITNKVDPGPFGDGHNNSFSFQAKSLFPSPTFASPQEFSPKRGVPPDFEGSFFRVSLFGKGFNAADVEVLFGDVPAEIFSRSDSGLVVGVPFMEPGVVAITVATSLGEAKSVDFFKISPHPEIFDLDPFTFGDHGDSPAGRTFTIIGSNFIVEPGDTVLANANFSTIGEIDGEFGPIGGGVSLEVLSTGPSNIVVKAGEAPDFFKFIGGDGSVTVRRSDGGAALLEFVMKGL